MKNLQKILIFSTMLQLGCENNNASTFRVPEKFINVSRIDPVVSNISISAKIDISAIQNVLDSKLLSSPYSLQTVVNDCYKIRFIFKKSGDCDIDAEFKKSGSLSLTGEGDIIKASLPGHIRVTGEVKGIGIKETAHADVTGFLSIKPVITPDWQLTLNPESHLEWNSHPKVKIFNLISLDVPDSLMNVANSFIEKQSQEVREDLNKTTILDKSKFSHIWEESFKPIKISSNPDAWLRLGPQQVNYSGVSFSNNSLTAVFNIKGSTEVFASQPDSLPATSLPQLSIGENQDSGINLHIPLTIPYSNIEKNLNSVLSKYIGSFKYLGNALFNVRIKNTQVYPSGDLLVIGIDYVIHTPFKKQESNGRIFVTGRPLVDNEKKEIGLTDISVISKSGGYLRLLDSMLKAGVDNIIHNQLRVTYKDDYDNLINQLDKSLNFTIFDGLSIHGKINNIEYNNIHLTEDNATMLLYVSGHSEIYYNKI